ncbi:MAG: hypothetical protein V4662_05675 [Verrucomicrobiota bacterium]
MNHTCPRCRRDIYDRHLKSCGYCDAPIPQDRQYAPHQIAVLDLTLAELNEQRWKQEVNAERRRSHIVLFPENSSV